MSSLETHGQATMLILIHRGRAARNYNASIKSFASTPTTF
jgi:hypothetical protein